MKGRTTLLLAVVLSLIAAGAASAQSPCTIETIAGTYAVYINGAANVGTLAPPDTHFNEFHYDFLGGSAVLLGRITVGVDGSVNGPMWGVFIATPYEFPFQGQITVNPDCTGELNTGDNTYKLVVLDNGREIRAITWEGFGVSVDTWRRIAPADAAEHRCGPRMLRGSYLMRCDGLEFTGQDLELGTVTSLFTLRAARGEMTGRLTSKRFGLPSTSTESDVRTTYTVHEDCTVDLEMFGDFLPPGVSLMGRGVMFDQGKGGYAVPLGMFAGGNFVAPVAPMACELVRR